MEIVDELVVISILVLLLQLSGKVYPPGFDGEVKYDVGVAINYLVLFHILYHLTLMAVTLVRQVSLRVWGCHLRR